MTRTVAPAACSRRASSGISREHLGELIAELAPVWEAQHESALRKRRRGERRRAAGADTKHRLVFVNRVLATLVKLRLGSRRPIGRPRPPICPASSSEPKTLRSITRTLNYLELRLTDSLLNYRDAPARMPKHPESLQAASVMLAALASNEATEIGRHYCLHHLLCLVGDVGQDPSAPADRDLFQECVDLVRSAEWLLYSAIATAPNAGCASYAFEILDLVGADRERLRALIAADPEQFGPDLVRQWSVTA